MGLMLWRLMELARIGWLLLKLTVAVALLHLWKRVVKRRR